MKKPLTVLLAAATLGACAVNGTIEEAQNTYEEASQSAEVKHYSPQLLEMSQSALERAKEANTKSERAHFAYLARRYAELASIKAQQGVAQRETEQLGVARDRLRLQISEAELAALEARETERGWVMTLDGVLFETGGTEIKPGASEQLDNLIDYLNANPQASIRVEGHTDATGGWELNQRLSRERAEAVRQVIISRGIDPQRIDARGYGESRPIATNNTVAGRQLNRRVDVLILKPEKAGTAG